tara:strand:- start:676 stop:1167 length:492 start_codon:yes stop_codon:yes gene_type:complete
LISFINISVEAGEDMPKFGRFNHNSNVTQVVNNVGTSFDKAKVHVHSLLDNTSSLDQGQAYQDKVEGFYIRVTNIAGGSATPTITLRATCDADGDLTFFPDTAGELALGLTTTNSGVAVYEFKLPLFTPLFDLYSVDLDKVYIFIKIDQGTCTLANSSIVWVE